MRRQIRVLLFRHVRFMGLRTAIWRGALKIVRASLGPCAQRTWGTHAACIFWQGHRRRCQTRSGLAWRPDRRG